jgi:hypothetical protein
VNARIDTAAHFVPRDQELEELALGVALLGYPLPDWLSRFDFTGANALIFQAARELGGKASLPTVAALMRDQGTMFRAGLDGADRHSRPGMLSSLDLVAMLEHADWVMSMGWAVDFERLRELGKQRRLVECMQRAIIKLRHGAVETADVMREMEELF